MESKFKYNSTKCLSYPYITRFEQQQTLRSKLTDTTYRSSRPKVFCKKSVLRNVAKFTGKHLRQGLFFNKVAGLRPQPWNFIKKETLAHVFLCGFCEISKDIFFYRTLPVAASTHRNQLTDLQVKQSLDWFLYDARRFLYSIQILRWRQGVSFFHEVDHLF